VKEDGPRGETRRRERQKYFQGGGGKVVGGREKRLAGPTGKRGKGKKRSKTVTPNTDSNARIRENIATMGNSRVAKKGEENRCES